MAWMYREPGGETRGPFSTDELAGLIREGKVTRNAFVAPEGVDDKWAYPAEHREFRDAVLGQQAIEAGVAERNRATSTTLPDVIRVVAGLALFAGIGGLIAAFVTGNLWLTAPALSSLLSAPFLFGFADIVLSLRKLCAKP